MTRKEAFKRAKFLLTQGYEVIPADDVLSVRYGLLCWQNKPNVTDDVPYEEEHLTWPMFTENTKVSLHEVDGFTLYDFFKQGKVIPADSVKELKIGFLRYDAEFDVAIIMQSRMKDLKRDLGVLKSFNENRDILFKNCSYDERLKDLMSELRA